jgi:hypothetical protein
MNRLTPRGHLHPLNKTIPPLQLHHLHSTPSAHRLCPSRVCTQQAPTRLTGCFTPSVPLPRRKDPVTRILASNLPGKGSKQTRQLDDPLSFSSTPIAPILLSILCPYKIIPKRTMLSDCFLSEIWKEKRTSSQTVTTKLFQAFYQSNQSKKSYHNQAPTVKWTK